MNTKELIEKTRELLEKATEGPWLLGPLPSTTVVCSQLHRGIAETKIYESERSRTLPEIQANAALIVHLRNHTPALLDALAALEAERDGLRKALEQMDQLIPANTCAAWSEEDWIDSDGFPPIKGERLVRLVEEFEDHLRRHPWVWALTFRRVK